MLMKPVPESSVVELVEEGKQVRLVFRGAVGVKAAGQIKQAAVRALAMGKNTTIDCYHAEYLDIATLQILLSLREELRGQGRSLGAVGISSEVEKYLRLAGLRDALLASAEA